MDPERTGDYNRGLDEEWCESCKRLKKELEKVKTDQAMNFTMLKEKIISTDQLIKKYSSKCQEYENLNKIHEQSSTNRDKLQRECEALTLQRQAALADVEPLRRSKEIQEKKHELQEKTIETLQTKVKALENSLEQAKVWKSQRDVEDTGTKQKIRELESSKKKSESLCKKFKVELQGKKNDLIEVKKTNGPLKSANRRLQMRVQKLEEIIARRGLYKNSVAIKRKSLPFSSLPASPDLHDPVSPPLSPTSSYAPPTLSPPLTVASPTCVNRSPAVLDSPKADLDSGAADVGGSRDGYEDICEELGIHDLHLLRPLSPALSPLTVSPAPYAQEISSDGDASFLSDASSENGMEEFADLLENQLLHPSPTKLPPDITVESARSAQGHLNDEPRNQEATSKVTDKVDSMRFPQASASHPWIQTEHRRDSESCSSDKNNAKENRPKARRKSLQANFGSEKAEVVSRPRQTRVSSHGAVELFTPGKAGKRMPTMHKQLVELGQSERALDEGAGDATHSTDSCDVLHHNRTSSRKATPKSEPVKPEVHQPGAVDLSCGDKAHDLLAETSKPMKRSGFLEKLLAKGKVNVGRQGRSGGRCLEEQMIPSRAHSRAAMLSKQPVVTDDPTEDISAKPCGQDDGAAAVEGINILLPRRRITRAQAQQTTMLKAEQLSLDSDVSLGEEASVTASADEAGSSGDRGMGDGIDEVSITSVHSSTTSHSLTTTATGDHLSNTKKKPIKGQPRRSPQRVTRSMLLTSEGDRLSCNTQLLDSSQGQTDPILDKRELPLDKIDPSLDKTHPSLDKTHPSLDKTDPTLDRAELSLDKAELSLDKAEPFLDKTEPSLDKAEPSLDKAEPSLNKAELSLDKAEPSLDKAEPSPNKAEPSPNKAEPSLNMTEPSLNKTEPSLDMAKPCKDQSRQTFEAQLSVGFEASHVMSQAESSSVLKTVQESDHESDRESGHEGSNKKHLFMKRGSMGFVLTSASICPVAQDLTQPSSGARPPTNTISSGRTEEDPNVWSQKQTLGEHLALVSRPEASGDDRLALEEAGPSLSEVVSQLGLVLEGSEDDDAEGHECREGHEVDHMVPPSPSYSTFSLHDVFEEFNIQRALSPIPPSPTNNKRRNKKRLKKRKLKGQTLHDSLHGHLKHSTDVPNPPSPAKVSRSAEGEGHSTSTDSAGKSLSTNKLHPLPKKSKQKHGSNQASYLVVDVQNSTNSHDVGELSRNLNVGDKQMTGLSTQDVISSLDTHNAGSGLPDIQQTSSLPAACNTQGPCQNPGVAPPQSVPSSTTQRQMTVDSMGVKPTALGVELQQKVKGHVSKRRPSEPAAALFGFVKEEPPRKLTRPLPEMPASDVTALERELQFLVRFALTDSYNIEEKIINLRPTPHVLTDKVVQLLLQSDMDMVSSAANMCRAGQTPISAPWITASEMKLMKLLAKMTAQQGMERLYEGMYTACQKALRGAETHSLPATMALVRFMTSLCRVRGELQQALALAYSCVFCFLSSFQSLLVAMATAWPLALQKDADKSQPLVDMLEFLVFTPPSLVDTNNSKVLSCLHHLCGWSTPPHTASDMSRHYLHQMETLSTSADHQGEVEELASSLVLLAGMQGWKWSNNTLVVDLIWPPFRGWWRSLVATPQAQRNDVFIICLIHLLGEVGSLCPAEHKAAVAEDVMTTLVTLVKEPHCHNVAHSVQTVVIHTLLKLSPFQPKLVAETCVQWLRHGQNVDAVKTPIRELVTFYKGRMKSV